MKLLLVAVLCFTTLEVIQCWTIPSNCQNFSTLKIKLGAINGALESSGSLICSQVANCSTPEPAPGIASQINDLITYLNGLLTNSNCTAIVAEFACVESFVESLIEFCSSTKCLGYIMSYLVNRINAVINTIIIYLSYLNTAQSNQCINNLINLSQQLNNDSVSCNTKSATFTRNCPTTTTTPTTTTPTTTTPTTTTPTTTTPTTTTPTTTTPCTTIPTVATPPTTTPSTTTSSTTTPSTTTTIATTRPPPSCADLKIQVLLTNITNACGNTSVCNLINGNNLSPQLQTALQQLLCQINTLVQVVINTCVTTINYNALITYLNCIVTFLKQLATYCSTVQCLFQIINYIVAQIQIAVNNAIQSILNSAGSQPAAQACIQQLQQICTQLTAIAKGCVGNTSTPSCTNTGTLINPTSLTICQQCNSLQGLGTTLVGLLQSLQGVLGPVLSIVCSLLGTSLTTGLDNTLYQILSLISSSQTLPASGQCSELISLVGCLLAYVLSLANLKGANACTCSVVSQIVLALITLLNNVLNPLLATDPTGSCEQQLELYAIQLYAVKCCVGGSCILNLLGLCIG